MDRHKTWRRVQYDYNEASKHPPNGHESVVLVWTAGTPAPLEPTLVETLRDPDYAWVRFQISGRDKNDQAIAPFRPDTAWVHVPESSILRVDVCFQPAAVPPRAPIGFGLRSPDKEPKESTGGM
jgi:hypothetical protein